MTRSSRGPSSETEMLLSTVLMRRMPGMTVETAGELRQKRSAISGSVPGTSSRSFFRALTR